MARLAVEILKFGRPILPSFGRVGILIFVSALSFHARDQFDLESQPKIPALGKAARTGCPTAKSWLQSVVAA
jgi:hypothetical protein